MMRSILSLTLVLCLVVSELPVSVCAQSAARQPPAPTPLNLTWSDLAPVVTGQRVEVYPAGVRGTAVTVTDDALVVCVTRTSHSSAHPRGTVAIPRTSVELITLERNRIPWRLGGVLVGITGALVGTAVARRTALRRTPWLIQLWLGLISAYPVMLWTGHLVRHLDTRVTLIRIVP
jgi:hypothetical protein